MDYRIVCETHKCKQFVEWNFGYGKCYSCKLRGQSVRIEKYPTNCEFKSKMLEIDKVLNINNESI